MKRFLLLTSALLFLLPSLAKAQAPAEGRTFPGPYAIQDRVVISKGEFILNGRELEDWEIRQVIGNEIFEETFAPACRQRKAGKVLCIVGGITAGLGGITAGISGLAAIVNLGGMAMDSAPDWEQDGRGRPRNPYNGFSSATAAFAVGSGICMAGSVMLSAGIPLLVIGQKRLNWVEEDTNRKLSQSASLSLGTSSNGFGLCLAF